MNSACTNPEIRKEQAVQIGLAKATLEADLFVPAHPCGVVLFAHGSGSSRFSPRNLFVSKALHRYGIATLRMDLLTESEEEIDRHTAQLRFNIHLLAKRLAGATAWILRQPDLRGVSVGYFGASTGAAAALVAAGQLPGTIAAIVSRGGRPDLAESSLAHVDSPTLLIVGGEDGPVIDLNEHALADLACSDKKLVIVPGATHLFEEPGKLEEVAKLAGDWFSHSFAVKSRLQTTRIESHREQNSAFPSKHD